MNKEGKKLYFRKMDRYITKVNKSFRQIYVKKWKKKNLFYNYQKKKLMKLNHPDLRLSETSKRVIDDILREFVEEIMQESEELASSIKKQTIKPRQIEFALKLIVGREKYEFFSKKGFFFFSKMFSKIKFFFCFRRRIYAKIQRTENDFS